MARTATTVGFLAVLTLVGTSMAHVGSAAAAFPGKPGPIAYSKVSSDEVAEGRVESVGGLFTARAAGQAPRPLTTDTGDRSPSYSADGRPIVFVHQVEGRSHIFTIRLDGSGLRQLTRGPHDDYDPVVSPDGRRIAFVSNRAGGSNVFVARLGGSRAKKLTNCNPFPPRCRSFPHPAFSPSGTHIVALSSGARTSGIEVMRSDGRGSYSSFDDAGTEEEGFGGRLGVPTWGPRPR